MKKAETNKKLAPLVREIAHSDYGFLLADINKDHHRQRLQPLVGEIRGPEKIAALLERA